MTIINTIDLSGAAIDWAVAKAVGHCTRIEIFLPAHSRGEWSPSTNWAQGGPLIKSEQISLSGPGSRVHRNGGPNAGWGRSGHWTATTWHAGANGRRALAWHDDDPLIAAMRCFAISRLGDTVDIPQELAA